MFLDALLKVSAAQAMGAGAVSTNSIDLALTTPGRQIGTGEPMGFGINVDVGATVAATVVEVISATDAALTAGILSHASITIPLASAVAGFQAFIGVPQGTPTQRFLGVRTTTAGGTITISAWLSTWSMFSLLQRFYPKNYAV